MVKQEDYLEQNVAQEDAISKKTLHKKTISGNKYCAERLHVEQNFAQEDDIWNKMMRRKILSGRKCCAGRPYIE